jgi:hypothetical protein
MSDAHAWINSSFVMSTSGESNANAFGGLMEIS